MSRLPAVAARRAVAALERAGCVCIRSKGSHRMYRHPTDARRQAFVPYDSADLAPQTLRSIRKQAGLNIDEFLKRL
ncbi:MAG: type II toxin-antitoxin system HicA family toxin [Pseudomonadota bacterium]